MLARARLLWLRWQVAIQLPFRPRLLRVRAGDVLVLHMAAPISNEGAARLGEGMRRVFPDCKLLILDSTVARLMVVRDCPIERVP